MIYGLVAALGWGLADFFGAVAGRRIGSFATVVIGQVLSATFMTVLVLATNSSASALAGLIGFVLVNGIATAVAYATHYRALELGPVAIVSPIGASYAVVGVMLAVIVLHERPAPIAYAGVVVTVMGSIMVSTDLPAVRAGMHTRAPGLPLAIVAAIGFGVAAFLLAYVVRNSAWVVGLWASRVAQVACYVPFAVLRRDELRALRSAAVGGILVALLAGGADILGVTSYSVGAERGFVTIVLGASAVFPLIAVVLSHVVLREERLALNQYAGILLVVAGLLLLGLASS